MSPFTYAMPPTVSLEVRKSFACSFYILCSFLVLPGLSRESLNFQLVPGEGQLPRDGRMIGVVNALRTLAPLTGATARYVASPVLRHGPKVLGAAKKAAGVAGGAVSKIPGKSIAKHAALNAGALGASYYLSTLVTSPKKNYEDVMMAKQNSFAGDDAAYTDKVVRFFF